LVWGEIRHDDVLRILHNPRYAGTFVFGRTQTRKGVDGKIHITDLSQEDWQVVIHDAHVGYISWEEYEANLAQLKANSQAYTPARLSPPREGPALLQGLVICGHCGNRMTVRYHLRYGRRVDPDYVCQQVGIQRGEAPCQRIPGRNLDHALSNYLLETVTPEMVAVTLTIQDELVARAAEAARLRQLQVERAQYEADLAQRRYIQVDPDNRLVASVLEAEWNEKLRELAAACERAAQQQRQDEKQFSQVERDLLQQTPTLFQRVWCNSNLPHRERKRIIRLIVTDVTLFKDNEIRAAVRFKGGATHTLHIPLPRPFAQSRTTLPETIATIDRLLNDYTDADVATQLNQQNIKTLEGLSFTATHVYQLRRGHQLKSRFTRLREAGWKTADEVAEKFGVTRQTVWRWYRHDLLEGTRYNDSNWCLFLMPETRPVEPKRPRHSK
jgi:hypothetical protein